MTPKEMALKMYNSLTGLHDSDSGEKIYFTHDTIKSALILIINDEYYKKKSTINN